MSKSPLKPVDRVDDDDDMIFGMTKSRKKASSYSVDRTEDDLKDDMLQASSILSRVKGNSISSPPEPEPSNEDMTYSPDKMSELISQLAKVQKAQTKPSHSRSATKRPQKSDRVDRSPVKKVKPSHEATVSLPTGRYCEFCKHERNIGPILLCRSCRRAYHFHCLWQHFEPKLTLPEPDAPKTKKKQSFTRPMYSDAQVSDLMQQLTLEAPSRLLRCNACYTVVQQAMKTQGGRSNQKCTCPTCVQPDLLARYRKRTLFSILQAQQEKKGPLKTQKRKQELPIETKEGVEEKERISKRLMSHQVTLGEVVDTLELTFHTKGPSVEMPVICLLPGSSQPSKSGRCRAVGKQVTNVTCDCCNTNYRLRAFVDHATPKDVYTDPSDIDTLYARNPDTKEPRRYPLPLLLDLLSTHDKMQAPEKPTKTIDSTSSILSDLRIRTKETVSRSRKKKEVPTCQVYVIALSNPNDLVRVDGQEYTFREKIRSLVPKKGGWMVLTSKEKTLMGDVECDCCQKNFKVDEAIRHWHVQIVKTYYKQHLFVAHKTTSDWLTPLKDVLEQHGRSDLDQALYKAVK